MYETNTKALVNAEACVEEMPTVAELVRRIHDQAAACCKRAAMQVMFVSGGTEPPHSPDEARSMREDLALTSGLLSQLEAMLEHLGAVLGA